MATIAARAAVAALAAVSYVLLGSCAPAAPPAEPPAPVPVPRAEPPPAAPRPTPEPEPEPPAPETAEPEIRVGLASGAPEATLGGGAELVGTDAAGARLAVIPAGEVWRVGIRGVGITVTSPGGGSSTPADVIGITGAGPDDPVQVNGRLYRGVVDVLRDRAGLTLVNRLGMEAYLQGVVSAEMGRRDLAEREALRAQAVVSRTYAHRNLRRWNALGFDLYATVSDQVYGGLSAETPEGIEAVSATRGRVLTHGGAPIDAFFYSTCGGRTAQGTEVFRAADRPYLRSVADVAEDGTSYCRISPRYRWREEWTGESLLATLRRTLPTATGTPLERVGGVNDVRVVYRTGSGRVGQLAIALRAGEVRVDGPSVRSVLRPASGELLRSNAFELTVTGAGRGVTRLVAEGGGAGHGVGFCQWGAVGRARAGHDFRRILAVYYPSATVERFY
ncbi:MAG TPA: SpoIID/LytB domain-containing protein [Gemmatimonadales bacterium]|nr:SpoIID/LytB domain-containing protein [Gemmatimonadales bacterium]